MNLNKSKKKISTLIIIVASTLIVIAVIARAFLLSKAIPTSVQILTLSVMLVTLISARIWIKRVPDLKNREEQTFTMMRISSICFVIFIVFTTLLLLLILVMASLGIK